MISKTTRKIQLKVSNDLYEHFPRIIVFKERKIEREREEDWERETIILPKASFKTAYHANCKTDVEVVLNCLFEYVQRL